MSIRDLVAVLVVAVVAVAAWEFLPPFFGVPKFIIPTFSQTVTELFRMAQAENLCATRCRPP